MPKYIMKRQEPITRSLQLPHIPVTAFSKTDLLLVWINLEFRSPHWPHRPIAMTSTDWCWHVDMMLTCSREVAVFLPKRARVDWNWPISREKISKNRLVCKNAVALTYYGSRRLLVMGSWKCMAIRHSVRMAIHFVVNFDVFKLLYPNQN